MKKTLLLLSVFVGLVLGASAQCTPADSTNFPSGTYIYPASLDTIYNGQNFSGTVTIKIPDSLDAHDFISIIPMGMYKAPIDSVEITSITGMPSGITQASNPVNGTWLKPGQYACATFSGTSTAASGNYPLTITGNGCGHFTFSGTTYDSCFQNYNFSSVYPYSLTVAYPTGISKVSETLDFNVFPNPNQGSFTVAISSAARITGTLSVVDQLGRTVNTQSIDVTGAKLIPVNLSDIAPGAYLLVINAGGSRSVKQFIVK
jgi:hypothetical protein